MAEWNTSARNAVINKRPCDEMVAQWSLLRSHSPNSANLAPRTLRGFRGVASTGLSVSSHIGADWTPMAPEKIQDFDRHFNACTRIRVGSMSDAVSHLALMGLVITYKRPGRARPWEPTGGQLCWCAASQSAGKVAPGRRVTRRSPGK